MKIKQVKHYKKPGYPTRKQFLSDPSGLQDHVPESWKTNKTVMSGLAVFLMGVSGNNAQTQDKMQKQYIASVTQEYHGGVKEQQDSVQQKNLSLIAPIFVHGDGRGATGCVVMNPPVFLNEEEARQIVETEFKKENILFDKKNVKLDEVGFEREFYKRSTKYDTVVIDGFSTTYGFGYEVITAEDYRKFVDDRNYSTVQSYDLIQAAENLREKMKEYGKMNTVIFYDPMERNESEDKKNRVSNEAGQNELESDSDESQQNQNVYLVDKSKSIELLKRQVQDFIAWVHKEGLLQK
jgi:hypothetical protein